MRFKSLFVGETFEFDHSHFQHSCSGLAHGPWVKTSTRTYVHADGDKTQRHRVGTIHVGVRSGGETCGKVR